MSLYSLGCIHTSGACINTQCNIHSYDRIQTSVEKQLKLWIPFRPSFYFDYIIRYYLFNEIFGSWPRLNNCSDRHSIPSRFLPILYKFHIKSVQSKQDNIGKRLQTTNFSIKIIFYTATF